MIKLKPITEKSWLVIGEADDTNIGLLTEIRNQYTLMLKGVKQQFLNKVEVNKFFKEDVFNNVVKPVEEKEVKDVFIDGFPVDYDNPLEVIMTGTSLPLYKKTENSEVYFSAGHFCLKFPKGWMPAFCPKLSTLLDYDYSGPHKTEMEMKAKLLHLRREDK